MRIVARRRISGLIEPVMIGIGSISLAISVLLIQPIQWYEIAIAAYLFFFGAFWVILGVKGWWPRGIGLVFSPDGFSWHAPMRLTLGSWIISWCWDDVLRAHHVTGRAVRFAGRGAVILELAPGARSWPNAKWAKKASNQMQKRLGQPLSDNVVVLHGQWWNWRPEEVAAWINESVSDPASRERWGGSDPFDFNGIAQSCG